MNSWMEVSRQWKQGVVYPRWAEFAHYAYGEARFIFYPPASWTLGALLGLILPWKLVPGAYIGITLTLSGCSMFLLARRWLDYRDATFAAVFYAVNPYYVVIVYWRSALAELLAGALLPLLLLFILDLTESEIIAQRNRTILCLTLVVSAAWLTNLPSAVMVNYSLALLIVVVASLRRSPRLLFFGGLAVVLGLALSAFYVFPAAYEGRWVNLSEVLSPGIRPVDNFLFTYTENPDHNRFNLLTSIVASAELMMLAAAALFSRRLRRSLRWGLLIWGLAAGLLMSPVTSILWRYLPELRYVQLPWRWLLCLNVAVTLLIVSAWKSTWQRILIYGTLLFVIVFTGREVQPPWWETAADMAEMEDSFDTGSGNEGTDEYVPASVDSSDVNKNARRVSAAGNGRADIQIQQWDAETKRFTVKSTNSQQAMLRLFNYPAWQVEVNGLPVKASSRENTGEMLIPIGGGVNQIHVGFSRTWDRTVGGIISMVTGILIAAWLVFSRPRGLREGK